MWESEELQVGQFRWWKFAEAINSFNENRSENIMTSSDRILDESMSAFRPRTSKTGGLPNISYILRKPEPLGTEFKSCVCPITKVMVHLEIQRGKNGMADQLYNKKLGATTGCTVRIAQRVSQTYIDGTVETVKGDAWFGSVKAVCNVCRSELGGEKEAVFQLKNNSRGYPKKAITEFLQDEPGGASIVLKATDPDTEVGLVVVGYKYNSKAILFFIASEGAGTTRNGAPYRMKFPDRHGNIVVRDIPRPSLISRYFEQSNCVDVHNQLRQYALRLEKNWVTSDPYFRLHTTLTGINVVDTFRLCQHHSIFQMNNAALPIQEKSDIFEGERYNAGCDASNIHSMTRFAGTLTKQLLIYARRTQEASPFTDNTISNPLQYGPDSLYNRYYGNSSAPGGRIVAADVDTTMSDDEIEVLTRERQEENGDTTATTEETDFVEILDEVYDKNGKVHHCVKQEIVFSSTGNASLQSRRCRAEGCMAKTRAKCLQCGLAYCFPIRESSSVSKINNCFTNHVHHIPKIWNRATNTSYTDMSGRHGSQ